MIRNTGESRVDIRSAEVFRSDILARRGFDERRSAEEDRAGALADDGFVAHGRNVRPACRATAHHRRDLRNLFGGHARLIVEDATEMIDIGKDFVLQGQKRPARIDEIQAGQMILFGDLLGAQMFLDRHREIRSAFDGGVVGNYKHFAIRNAPDAGDDARTGTFVVVKISRGEGREFEKWRARVEQTFDAFTDKEFALFFLSLAIFFAATFTDARETLFEFAREGAMVFGVLFEFGRG